MPRVFDLASGKESDDEHGLPGDDDALPGTPRKRAKIKPSVLEKAWVRTTVTAALFVVVVASIAFLIVYLRPRGNATATGPNSNPGQIVGSGPNDLGPPLKDSAPSGQNR